MKAKKIFQVILLALFLFPTLISYTQELNKNLSTLKPLLEKTWTGILKAPDGSGGFTVTKSFQVFGDGNVIKVSETNKDLDNYGEGFIYWEDVKKQMNFFFINNKGVYQEGSVKCEEKIITIEGTMTWPTQMNPNVKQSYDFKNTFEFTSDGKMIDKWFQNAFGPWRPGHEITYE